MDRRARWKRPRCAVIGADDRCSGAGRESWRVEMAAAAPLQDEPDDVAIVGIALRFPGARTPGEYWSNLRAGVESVRTFTDEELVARGVSAQLLRDPAYVKSGSVLEG